MKKFSRILVANRGEIARRIFRTCKNLGYGTVAVYSDADRHAPFVADADQAVLIGDAEAAASYLNQDRIIEAAHLASADAIHPGYGFLSENPKFAERVEKEGLVFIGPTAAAMRVMGDKAEARQFMSAAGVAVTPGYDGEDQSDDALIGAAKSIGLPVMVKAAAGGGGKGMSIVHKLGDLLSAVQQARRLALSAFGSDRLIVEKYIENPRHLEVQVLGDLHGNIIHVFERECSVQRRFQKVVEEAPAPHLSEGTRDKLHSAAVAAAAQVDYRSAGTVEFIADQAENFYFLEMNTRLQVEHPVTECISGLDLVEWQIRIASGEQLPSQESIHANGHAIEVRLYAEDPAEDYLPSVGHISAYREPVVQGVRFDSGIQQGSEITIYYDPMLAKVIATGGDRWQASRRLRAALDGFVVDGVRTNRRFLSEVLAHPVFQSGRLDTGFLAREFEDWSPSEDLTIALEHLAALVAFLSKSRGRRSSPLPVTPGWRLFGASSVVDIWHGLGVAELEVSYHWQNMDTVEVQLSDDRYTLTVLSQESTFLRYEIESEEGAVWQRSVEFVTGGSVWHVLSSAGQFTWTCSSRFPEPEVADFTSGCIAPMPGRIVRLLVAEGESVESGTPLIVLEAMKMEQTLFAGGTGTVETVFVSEGDLVGADDTLVQIDYEDA